MTSAELQVDGALERCKNFSHGNGTMPEVTKDASNDTDFGAVMYIIAVLTFYSLGIVVMIVKYLKTERKEMEEEMVLDSFFKGIPNKKIEHEIESVNRVAIHAFHTLTASRGMPCEGSIPNSVASNYTETNSGRRDSEDLVMNHASYPYLHGEFDSDPKQTTDAYLTVDQSSFHRYGGHRRHRRGGDGAAVSLGNYNDVDEPSSEDAHEIDCVVSVDAENREIDSQGQLRATESNQPSIIFHNLAYAKDESPRLEKSTKSSHASENGKVPPKRNKTVIFSDAIKPARKEMDDLSPDEESDLLCPKSLSTRRYSDSMDTRTPRSDLPSNSKVASSGTPLTLKADDCSQKPNVKGATQFQRRFQVEPLRLLDIKPNGRVVGVDEGVKPERPQSMTLSSSCDAISDMRRRDKALGNRGKFERTSPETECSAFVNESSRLYHSNQNIHPYNSTSSRQMTTRVKFVDPKAEGSGSKKVLVTDL